MTVFGKAFSLILIPTVGAKAFSHFLMRWSRAAVGGSVALPLQVCWPMLRPALIKQFIKCCVDFGALALFRFGSPPLVADRLTDK